MTWPLLESLPDADRQQVLATCRRRRFKRDEVLFHEGDTADSVQLLTRGRATVGVTTPDGDVATLTVVGPGATFGELTLVSDPPVRSATVTAMEACETLSLHGAAFATLRSRFPAVEKYLLEAIAGQVRRLSAQLVEALYLPADRRVLRRLLDLTDVYADEAQPKTLVPVTQVMLASMAGTSRVTTNQALQRAKDRGCVELTRGRIYVVNKQQLARIAR
jgi:CRP/FNR family cyclic AMP-dependent transcriptional regulator